MLFYFQHLFEKEPAIPTYNKLPEPSPLFKDNLYTRLTEVLQLAGLAKRTDYGYVRAIRKLADFHQKAPD